MLLFSVLAYSGTDKAGLVGLCSSVLGHIPLSIGRYMYVFYELEVYLLTMCDYQSAIPIRGI